MPFQAKKSKVFADLARFLFNDVQLVHKVEPAHAQVYTKMARITVEDCLDNESNRFALVRLAAARAKQILEGSDVVAETKTNRAVVSALREIADGKVRFEEVVENEELISEGDVAEESEVAN